MSEVTYKTWDRAVLLPIEDLVFTDWNVNEMDDSMLGELLSDIQPEQVVTDGGPPASGSNNRFDEPIQVVPIKGKKNKWLVIGGEHRTKAMRAIGETHIPAVIRYDLANKSRKELMLWSVRRNNLRGRVNAQKYAELEAELIKQHDMSVEAARKTMLISGDLAKALRASLAVRENEEDDSSDPDMRPVKGDNPDGAPDPQKTRRDQADLLQALRIVEQDVLLDSADTVEYGYLFFAQGKSGQLHLVVDMSDKLLERIKRAVAVCKGNAARIEDLFIAALDKELPEWE